MKHLSAITKTAPSDSGVDQVHTEHHLHIICSGSQKRLQSEQVLHTAWNKHEKRKIKKLYVPWNTGWLITIPIYFWPFIGVTVPFITNRWGLGFEVSSNIRNLGKITFRRDWKLGQLILCPGPLNSQQNQPKKKSLWKLAIRLPIC